MTIIKVSQLGKTFELSKKKEGLKSSFWSLFKREKQYLEAVKDISFEIEKGEFIGFLGPNGAGKTTTLKMLSGILYPSSGTATILGHTPWERKEEYKMQIAMVMGQKSQLWWDLPAIETFRLNQDIYEIPENKFQNNLQKLSDLLETNEFLHTPVRKLSLGQRMKCELIAALLHDPKVLFLDEPTIGLDVNSQRKMREFLKAYNHEHQATIILTSHYMDDIKSLCKRVIIIDKGQKMYDGEYDQLINNYAREKLIEITTLKNFHQQDLEKYGEIMEFENTKALLKIPREHASRITRELVHNLEIEDILVKELEASDVVADLFAQNHRT